MKTFENIYHALLRFKEKPECESSKDYEYLKKCCKCIKTILPDECLTLEELRKYWKKEVT